MGNIENKLKKPLIILTFIIITVLSSIQKLKEIFHFNDELNEVFDKGTLAATYAKYAYLVALIIGSFLSILLLKALWNSLIPRITKWEKIDYWDAMGIISIILIFSYI